MSYSSFYFLAFLVAVIVVYYAVPKKVQWVVLLAASYAFYLIDGVAQVAYLIGSTVVTYTAAMIMQKKRDAYKQDLAARQEAGSLSRDEKQELKKQAGIKIHRVQVLALIIQLAVLIVVKYLNFLLGVADSVVDLISPGHGVSTISILVPLGISFYTFMSMGYIIDIGKGKYEAERNFGKLALFLSFFPSVIQGPINRFDDVGRQLGEGHALKYENLTFGAQLMIWGFFKKLVIADRIAPLVATIFSDNYTEYSGTVFFVGMLGYAFQIYGDFSGGVDIAKGAAQMLGIELPNNFERPYFSESLADYWRRWHMTLGGWMREYVFFPIMLSKGVSKLSKKAKNRFGNQAAKIVSSVITTFTVFFLIGIWHGASFQYLAFGLYNAVIVAISVALEPLFEKTNKALKINTEAFSWKLFRIVRTFLITGGSKILVRSPGLKAATVIFGKIFTDIDLDFIFGVDGQIYTLGIDEKNMQLLILALLILLVVSILQEKGIKIRETLARQNIVFRWFVYIAAIVFILVFGMYGPEYNAVDFIYKQY
ncbi:MAG: MBOAT family protein [Lachnospiraceae bacterium]|nr:MBOAT family protein [Lachnospiraceae bacterium]